MNAQLHISLPKSCPILLLDSSFYSIVIRNKVLFHVCNLSCTVFVCGRDIYDKKFCIARLDLVATSFISSHKYIKNELNFMHQQTLRNPIIACSEAGRKLYFRSYSSILFILLGAFASYYWALQKPKDIPLLPLFSSFGRSLR